MVTNNAIIEESKDYSTEKKTEEKFDWRNYDLKGAMADLDAKVDAFTNQMQEINTAMVGALTKKVGKTRATDMEKLAKQRAE